MARRTYRLCSTVFGVLILGALLQAANIDKAIADAESRRKGAESSLREIMAKSDPQIDQARTSYTTAASSQNAWLDLVCNTIEQGATAAPDMIGPSQAAATALMDWVAVGGKVLGLPVLKDSVAKDLQKAFTQNLIEIGNTAWKTYSSADEKTRTEVVTHLKTRLRWKTAQEVS